VVFWQETDGAGRGWEKVDIRDYFFGERCQERIERKKGRGKNQDFRYGKGKVLFDTGEELLSTRKK